VNDIDLVAGVSAKLPGLGTNVNLTLAELSASS